MADKRIHELSTTSDKTGKFLALDEAGLPEALKFSADSLITKAFTDTLYVKVAGDETVNGVKTWANNGIFGAGITVTAGGIGVTGNSYFLTALGIGFATIPQADLHIKSSVSAAQIIDSTDSHTYIRYDNVGVIKYYAGYTTQGTQGFGFFNDAGALKVIITQAGYVGINTSTPSAYLEIAGSQGNIIFELDGNTQTFTRANANYIRATNAAGWFIFQTGGGSTANNRLHILANGNIHIEEKLGINTGTPTEKLTLSDTTASGILFQSINGSDDVSTGYIQFVSDATGRYSQIHGWRESSSQRHGLRFYYYNVTAQLGMTLSSDGHVGIGKIPVYHLDVYSGASNVIAHFESGDRFGIINLSDDTTGWSIVVDGSANDFRINDGSGGGGDAIITITSAANRVGINDTSPGYSLDITGDFRVTGNAFANSDLTVGGSIFQGDNDVHYFGAANEVALWFDGSHFYIRNTSHGNRVLIQAEDTGGTIQTGVYFDPDNSVNLYYNGGLRFHTDASGVIITGDLEVSSNIIINTSGTGLIADTADGADNQYLTLCGGGAASSSRGGVIIIGGNENGTYPGDIQINAGGLASSTVKIDGTINVVGAKVGIGIDPPAYVLDVQTIGATEIFIARFHNDYANTNSWGIEIRHGTTTVPAATTFISSVRVVDQDDDDVGTIGWDDNGFALINFYSSKEFKKGIKKTKIKGIEAVKAVRPRNYKLKGRTPEEEEEIIKMGRDKIEHEGYIIEELAVGMPDVIKETTTEDGKPLLGIAETGIIKYLHQAIIELEERLAILEP